MYANIGGMGWGRCLPRRSIWISPRRDRPQRWRNDKFVDARAAYIEPTYQDKEVARFTFVSDTSDVNYAQLDTPQRRGQHHRQDGDDTYQLTPVDVDQGVYTINYKGQTCKALHRQLHSPSTAPTRSSTSTKQRPRD